MSDTLEPDLFPVFFPEFLVFPGHAYFLEDITARRYMVDMAKSVLGAEIDQILVVTGFREFVHYKVLGSNPGHASYFLDPRL